MKKLPLCYLTVVSLFVGASTRASIVTSGNFDTGTPQAALTISAPITLTITTTGTAAGLAFDEWVIDDGNRDYVSPSSSGEMLSYQIDGGPVQTTNASLLIDNRDATSGALTPNDGNLLFLTFPVTAGQTLTLNAVTLTYDSNPNFNPPPSIFNGRVFLSDGLGDALSGPTVVPEPSTWALLGVGAAGAGVVALLRRRAS